MKLDRKKNSIRNIFFGIFNKIITILVPFFLRTIIIYTLGSEYLGLGSLFTAILQVLSLTELGLGSAMVFELYKPIAENDYDTIQKLQNLYKVIYRIIGIIIIILGLILLPFLSFFIKGSYPTDVNIYLLYVIYLINSSATYLFFSYKQTVLSAYQRRDIVSNIGTITHLILYVFQLVILLLFKNYLLYVICLPIFTIIESIITGIIVDKKYPYAKANGKLEKKRIKEIFAKVGDLFGHKLSNVVTNSIDTIVISTFLGLNMVTIYNNYFYLMSAIVGILDVLYQGILAGIGNSIVTETKEKNRKDFNKILFLNSWIVGVCTICFLFLYQPMIKIWMGNEMLLKNSAVLLLCIYFYVWKMRQVILIFKDAAGMWKCDKYKPYFEIILNLIVNVILVNVIGINGVIISTIISMLCISLPWETKVFFKKFFDDNTIKYYITLAKYTFCTIINALITFAFISIVSTNNIVYEMLFKSIICLFIPNLFYFLVYKNNVEFKNTLNMLKTFKFSNKSK